MSAGTLSIHFFSYADNSLSAVKYFIPLANSEDSPKPKLIEQANNLLCVKYFSHKTGRYRLPLVKWLFPPIGFGRNPLSPVVRFIYWLIVDLHTTNSIAIFVRLYPILGRICVHER
jgi:hypothetical protein